MAYPATFLRLIQRWNLPGGEVANVTCAYAASSPLVALDDTTVNAFATRSAAFWTALLPYYNSTMLYAGCSVAWIGTDGRTLMRQDRPVTPTGGNLAGNLMPGEVAAVISLRTALAGRRTRGRMYMPTPSYTLLDANSRWTSGMCTGFTTAAAALLAPLVVGAETFSAVVASATGSLLTPVTQVACGNVPDSQRRRRDRLIEAYTTHSVP